MLFRRERGGRDQSEQLMTEPQKITRDQLRQLRDRNNWEKFASQGIELDSGPVLVSLEGLTVAISTRRTDPGTLLHTPTSEVKNALAEKYKLSAEQVEAILMAANPDLPQA